MGIAKSAGQGQPSAGRTRWQINHFHHWKICFFSHQHRTAWYLAWFLLSVAESIKYDEKWNKMLIIVIVIVVIFTMCNNQATALKTSSGKGDLQCSATNAGDWVCILLLFPSSGKNWSADFPGRWRFCSLIEWNDHPKILSSANHQPIIKVIIPGIGRRCRYAWPATGSPST